MLYNVKKIDGNGFQTVTYGLNNKEADALSKKLRRDGLTVCIYDELGKDITLEFIRCGGKMKEENNETSG